MIGDKIIRVLRDKNNSLMSVVLFYRGFFFDARDVNGRLMMAELPRNALDGALVVLAIYMYIYIEYV